LAAAAAPLAARVARAIAVRTIANGRPRRIIRRRTKSARLTRERTNNVERVSILQQVPLFAELAGSELEIVTAASRRRLYPKGSIVFYEGDPGDYLLVVLNGRVKVTLLGKDGQETIIRVLGRLEFLGEIAIVDEAPRSATVIALERTEVLEIARESFLKVVDRHPKIALKIMTQLARALRRATEQIRTLSMFDVYGRVLRCLLMTAQDKGQSARGGRMVIRPRPSISEIARMVGCERETVSRAMKTLRATGYVTDVDRGLAVEQRAIRQYLLPTLQNLAGSSEDVTRQAS
jgi:CRP/FNR family transcriptional regulator, cyclic AMP receptor protein